MTVLNSDYGTTATLHGNPYSALEQADMRARDAARVRAEALLLYATCRALAFRAEQHNDPVSAVGLRADADAALHRFPKLLAAVR